MQSSSPIHTSIIIPTYNQADMLERLVDGLRKTAAVFTKPLELIVVDNNSDEAALQALLDELIEQGTTENTRKPFAAINILRYPHKFNYSAINNLAVKVSRGEHLCFLNNDMEIIAPTWLNALSDALAQANAGCAGAMLYYPDDTIQHAGVYLDPENIAGHLGKNEPRGSQGHNNVLLDEQIVSAVTAACLLVPRRIFDEVHGFDESLAVAFNDVDFCLKVKRAGYNTIWTPKAELYHHESKSRGLSGQRTFLQTLNHKKEVFLMKRRWRTELQHDQRHPGNRNKNEPTSANASRHSLG